MRVQVLSDVHLELGGNAPLAAHPAIAPVLVLAGDIDIAANLEHTFADAAARWKHTVFVPGNHEYYGSTKVAGDAAIAAAAAAYPSIHVLNNATVTIEGQRFVGSTLWSSPLSPYGLSDIGGAISGFTWLEMSRHNVVARDFLAATVQPGDVVVTHFAPLLLGDVLAVGHTSMYTPDPNTDRYFGNAGLGHVVARAPLWIYGHTHEAVDVRYRGCRMLCNPVGYADEAASGWKPTVVDLERHDPIQTHIHANYNDETHRFVADVERVGLDRYLEVHPHISAASFAEWCAARMQ